MKRSFVMALVVALFSALLHAPGGVAPASAGTAADAWRDSIDATWGPGLPTEHKLEIFDKFWQAVDYQFAAFQGIEDVDWAGLRARYRPEVADGVSRGRFAAIMNHLALALRESHTVARDLEVNRSSNVGRGIPLLSAAIWFSNRTGVCATAQADGSALVYAVSPDNPLGLVAGDRVVGFDGRPWPELYGELLEAELPIAASWWGSSPSSFEHTFVAAAALNWHLFETLDVARFASGRVEHIPTALLDDADVRSPFCSEQMDLPGIAKPVINADRTGIVSWGLLPGTRVGYVYVWGWIGDAGTGFAQAIEQLTQQGPTEGLILDFRFNVGGNMSLSNHGAAMLFDGPTATVGFDRRYIGRDHHLMGPSTPPHAYVVDAPTPWSHHDARSYDRPIAVLTGPGAVSSGDMVAERMTHHPRVRTFGKSTASAFNAPSTVALEDGWFSRIAVANAYRVDAPRDYLTHDEFPVDTPVWLTPEDVAAGRDTVVESAVRWIHAQR